MKGFSVALLFLTACSHTHVGVTNARSGAIANAQVQASGGLAALLLGGMLISADANESGSARTPDMDPDRAINEQDCTKPVDLTGNLRCR